MGAPGVEVRVVVLGASSTAPASQAVPAGSGRDTPRWSVPAQSGTALDPMVTVVPAGTRWTARLVGVGASVAVGPPLARSGPSPALTPARSWEAAANPHVLSVDRLYPRSLTWP